MADDTARTTPDTPNVRLNAALERETALREILSVIRDSRADEQPVFDAILHHARRLCDSPMAGLVMGRKGDRAQRLAASYGTKTVDRGAVRKRCGPAGAIEILCCAGGF